MSIADFTSLSEHFSTSYKMSEEKMSLQEFLLAAKNDSFLYANPAKRLTTIGEPTKIDTKSDPVLNKIFSSKTIRIYPAFQDFFGMEDVVESLVSYLRHAEQQLEESKSILYLLGPVGGGKSSLAEKLKELMEKQPIYVLGCHVEGKNGVVDELSPVFESPLNLFSTKQLKKMLEDTYQIPPHAIRTVPSPWALQRLRDNQGNLNKFFVVKIYPSILNQVAIAKVEPGDENNQDISTLVGKVDIRKLEKFPQDHPDAYSYSGGLCRAGRGILDFVEMFKAPLKMLNPLLTATQEKNFNGTEAIGAMPFDGIILAHSNESEWDQFKSNKTNEAFLDRITLVQVPYCLRYSEELKIYKKLISGSKLSEAPVAPGTYEMLAQFSVLSRLNETKLSGQYTKMQVYNGENLKNIDAKAKSLAEYKSDAGITEGMEGMSTRFAFKILSKVFNANPDDISANPLDLMNILVTEIEKERFQPEKEQRLKNYVTETLLKKYYDFLDKQIRKAIISSSDDWCQNVFLRYVAMANDWIEDQGYTDPNTGLKYNVESLNTELTKIEKPGLETNNPKQFREEIVKFFDKHRGNNSGEAPRWDAYSKMRDVIESKVIESTEMLLPIISFNSNQSEEDKKKHQSFVNSMKEFGYTENMIRILVEWFSHMQKGARS
jgi:serine protein kinase